MAYGGAALAWRALKIIKIMAKTPSEQRNARHLCARYYARHLSGALALAQRVKTACALLQARRALLRMACARMAGARAIAAWQRHGAENMASSLCMLLCVRGAGARIRIFLGMGMAWHGIS